VIAHYCVVALRNVRAKPFVSSLHVLTLTLGLTSFVTAYALATFWSHSDQHFVNADRTFVVTTDMAFRDGRRETGAMAGSSEHVAEYLRVDFPGLEAVARLEGMGQDFMVSSGERAFRVFAAAADPEFLRIFDLPFVAGASTTALDRPRSAVITEEFARRLFGDGDPMGRSLVLGNRIDTTITGIIGPIPEPSHMGRTASAPMRFDLLVSRDVLEAIREQGRDPDAPPPPENWLNPSCVTYVLLPVDGSVGRDDLANRLAGFARAHVPPKQLDFVALKFGLVPLTGLLGTTGLGAGFLRGSGLSAPTALMILGALVLAVACVNYTNLATSLAIGRSRDVGLRKVVGAKRRQIAAQHLLEAGLLTMAALILALACLFGVMPVIRASTRIDLTPIVLSSGRFWLGLVAVVTAATLAAGSYPAVVLSRVRPVASLQGKRLRVAGHLSALLVGTQFAAASFLLIMVTIIGLQNQALKRIGFGVASDPLVVISNPSDVTNLAPETLRSELLRLPGVVGVTDMQRPPWSGYATFSFSRSPAASAVQKGAMQRYVGYDFFSTFDMRLLAGRTYQPERSDNVEWGHPEEPMSAVVDRAFTEQLDLGSPEQAVGQIVYISQKLMTAFGGVAQPVRIIGVVENKPLNWRTMGPTANVYMLQSPLPYQIARISRDDLSGTLNEIDALWSRLVPDVAIERKFVDEIFDSRYDNFRRLTRVFVALAVFSILISAMGLLGMAILVSARRTREIGVRKAVGASVPQIVLLLLRGFSAPVVVASLAAWPLAYLTARAYLRFFVVPIHLTPVPFVACFASMLLLAWSSVASQTWQAARVRPASVLRQE
jgi:putative ABC transport system permease protein